MSLRIYCVGENPKLTQNYNSKFKLFYFFPVLKFLIHVLAIFHMLSNFHVCL